MGPAEGAPEGPALVLWCVAWWEESGSLLGPERPGLAWSLEVRAGDGEEPGAGSLAGANPRRLIRRQGASPAGFRLL